MESRWLSARGMRAVLQAERAGREPLWPFRAEASGTHGSHVGGSSGTHGSRVGGSEGAGEGWAERQGHVAGEQGVSHSGGKPGGLRGWVGCVTFR